MMSENSVSNSDTIEKKSNILIDKNKDPKSKQISTAIFASLIRTYGIIPLTLLTTWMVSHNLTQDAWGTFIHAIVLISGSQILLSFFPPSITTVILYKVPELKAKNDISQIKSLVQYALKTKFIISSLIMLCYIGVCLILSINSPNPLKLYAIIIYSPVIVMYESMSILITYLNALKNFKINVQLLFLERIIIILLYVIIFFGLDVSENTKVLCMIATNMISFIPTFVILFIIYLNQVKKITYTKLTWKTFTSYLQFGLYYSISSSSAALQDQIYYGILNLSPGDSLKTQYNVGRNFTGQAVSAFSLPVGPLLTELEQEGKRKEMLDIFIKSLSITSLILSLITGFLYYFLKIYVLIIYPPEYLEIVYIIRDYSFVIILINIIGSYNGLYSITRNEKNLLYMNLISLLILSVASIVGYLINSLHGFIIGQVIGAALQVLIFWVYGFYINGEFKLSLLKLLKYFISLIIIIFISNLLIKYFIPILNFTNISEVLSDWVYRIVKIDFSSQMAILLDACISLVLFFIIFIVYYLIFINSIKDEFRTVLNTGIKFPFKKSLQKILRL